MRENRTYGSEGGEGDAFPTPIAFLFVFRGKRPSLLTGKGVDPRDKREDDKKVTVPVERRAYISRRGPGKNAFTRCW